MELADDHQPRPIPYNSSCELQQTRPENSQANDDTCSKVECGVENDDASLKMDAADRISDVKHDDVNSAVIEDARVQSKEHASSKSEDVLENVTVNVEASAEATDPSEQPPFKHDSDPADNASRGITGGSDQPNLLIDGISLNAEQEDRLCKISSETESDAVSSYSLVEMKSVTISENGLSVAMEYTSSSNPSDIYSPDKDVQQSSLMATENFVHDHTEVSEMHANGNVAATNEQELCVSSCKAESIPGSLDDSLESADPEIVNSIEASLTEFFTAQEISDPTSSPKTIEDGAMNNECEMSTGTLHDQHAATNSANVCDNELKVVAKNRVIECEDLTINPAGESKTLSADLTNTVSCNDSLSQEIVENEKLQSVLNEMCGSKTNEVKQNDTNELPLVNEQCIDKVVTKDTYVAAEVKNAVSEFEEIHQPQEETENASAESSLDMEVTDSEHVNCHRSKGIDSETCEMACKVPNETRNVFDVFPVIVDGTEPVLNHSEADVIINDLKDNVNADTSVINTGNSHENKKSNDELNLSGHTKIMSYEEFLRSQEESLSAEKSTQKSRKNLSTRANKKSLSKRSYTVKKRTLDCEKNILEMAKRRYPGLKELRVKIKNVEDIKDSVQVASEPPEQTSSKKERILKSKTATSSKDKSHSLKSKSHEKVCLKHASVKGLSYELKSLKEPSIHKRISAENDRSIPLKKRTRHCIMDTVSQGHTTDNTRKSKLDKGNKPKLNLKGSKLKETKGNIPKRLEVQKSVRAETANSVSDNKVPCIQKKKSLKKSKDEQMASSKERSTGQLTVQNTDDCVNKQAVKMSNEKLDTDKNMGITSESNIFINCQDSSRKGLPNSTVVKKYPERTCKMRILQDYTVKEAKKLSKTDNCPITKPKTSVKLQEILKKETHSLDISEAMNKLKKKRKRKVKPWSWGNEKKRSKPKSKLAQEENLEGKDLNKNAGSIDMNDETSDNQFNVADAKTGTNDTDACSDKCESRTVGLVQNLSSQSSRTSKPTKSESTKSYVQNANIETNPNLESAASEHSDQELGAVHLVNANNPLELENVLNEENYQHESPDSGVQSFAGSPSGNESPNSVILSSIDNSGPNGLNILPSSSEQLPSSSHSSQSCLTMISSSSNAFVSSVHCVTASASVSSYSVTTSLSSSSETMTVFSIGSPLTSVTLPCMSSNYTDKVSNIASSVHSQLVYSTLCPVQSLADTNVFKNTSLQHSPSKKKNRSKFLHLHKASTLLQKGRLPTEEEKEQRLEDKFDYLNKNGAKSNCDKSLNFKNALTDTPVTISQATSTVSRCSTIIKTDSKMELTTINASDISQDNPIDMEKFSVIPSLSSFDSTSGSEASFEKRHEHLKRKKKQSNSKKRRKGSCSKTIEGSLTVEQSIPVLNNLNNSTDLPLDDNEKVETVSEAVQSEALYPNGSCSETESFCQDIVSSIIASVENGRPFLSTGTYQTDLLQPEVEDHDSSDGDRLMNNDGDRLMNNDGHRLMNNDGDRRMNSDGDRLMNSDDDRLMNNDGHMLINNNGDRLMNSDGDRLINSDGDRFINNDVTEKEPSLSSQSLDEDIEKGIIESEIHGAENNIEVEIFDKLPEYPEKGASDFTPEKDDCETLRDVMNGIHSVIKNWDKENKDHDGEFQLTLPSSNESVEENVPVQVPQKKRGRPPNKYKKRKLLTLQKYRNKYYYNVNKIKAKVGQPSAHKTYQDVIVKRRPGRPKGSKNKERTTDVKEKRPRGRPKGALNKVKKTALSASESPSSEVSTTPGTNGGASCLEHRFQKSTMMQWRESNVMHGIEGDEKKKRGRPRKKPLPDNTTPKKRGRPAVKDKKLQQTKVKKIKHKNSDSVEHVMMGPSDVIVANETVHKKHVKKKESKIKAHKQYDTPDALISPSKLDQEVDFESREPAQSISSHDSDTSGAGSHMCNRNSAIQLWMEMSRHRRKKNMKKLLHFRSKHKNIIDPVFNAEVDFLTGVFPKLSISPRGETYLKVRPGEVPLPSIFKIVRIDVKKKKKDKLFVFEKSKPIKQKNDELTTKDKIKLGRRISVLGESFMDNDDVTGQKACNLPPKKRHKLFTTPDDGMGKPEKRKVGRPRKQSVTVPSQESCAFGDLHRKKDSSFKMGRDGNDGMATFASVALSGCWPGFTIPSSEPQMSLVTKAATSAVAAKDVVGKTAQSSNCASAKEFSSPKKTVKDCANSGSKKTEKNLFTSFAFSTKETVSKSNDRSDDNFEGCHDAAHDQDHSGEITKDSAQTDGCDKRNLKRKLDHPSQTLPSKEKKAKKDLQMHTDNKLGNERVRSTVCPESEPLPVSHRDGESEGDESEKSLHNSKRSESVESQDSDTSIVKKQSTFQKKRYQRAGLYSASYKDEHSVKEKEMSSIIFTFDPPLHFGNHLMKTVTDFQLPYEIWWLHFNDMLPKKGDGQQYRRIRNNIYVDARPICRNEAHSCNCKTPSSPAEKGCGEDCLNRLIYTECSADLCPCGPSCSNQAIQKRQFAPGLQKFLTKDRGFGVRTTKPVKCGDLVTEYVGEVVSEQEFRRRMTEEYSQECHHYCLNLDGRMVIDGYRMGNIARFVNHSCEPNCEMQKWNVNGTYHMCLFALKDIEPGTELVYDYNFQSFNHDAQQICKCGSQDCRGTIGGRRSAKATERLQQGKNKKVKDKRKTKTKQDASKDSNAKLQASSSGCPSAHGTPVFSGQSMTPYTLSLLSIKKKERVYARTHAIFLVRNLDKLKQKLTKAPEVGHVEDYVKGTTFFKKDVIITQLTALKTSRSVKTRRLTVAEEDTEVNKMARLAGVCREIYSAVTAAKDEDGNVLAVPDLFHLPARKKHPWYYQVIQEPIDLTMIENRILSGEYTSREAFDKDMLKLFTNVETYCGKKSGLGEIMKQLRVVYSTAKRDKMEALQSTQASDQPGENQSDTESSDNIEVATPTTSVSSESDFSEVSDSKGEWAMEEEEEEVIRCICGIYKDEGLMIQCEKCYIWQHTDCMRVKGDEDNYLCEECEPRPIDREVEITPSMDDEDPVPDDGNRYYMTLMRDDMQIRLGTCVYVMKENQSKRYSYKRSGGLNKDKMDIFRIERLWKNDKGDKFAFGHTYIRPHESFHEPNRKFFPNEVFRTPLFEIFPLDSIVGYCCVLDLLTFCKGRPKGYRDEDIYICEYRMDKTLHLFYKISPKQRIQVNTKSYCFDMYEKRLNPKRNYLPHEVPESYKRNWRERSTSSAEGCDKHQAHPRAPGAIGRAYADPHWRKHKREKVNRIVESLCSHVMSPGKRRHDLSYLMAHPHK